MGSFRRVGLDVPSGDDMQELFSCSGGISIKHVCTNNIGRVAIMSYGWRIKTTGGKTGVFILLADVPAAEKRPDSVGLI